MGGHILGSVVQGGQYQCRSKYIINHDFMPGQAHIYNWDSATFGARELNY